MSDSNIVQERLPFPFPKDAGLPLACWNCWWREGRRCYNEKLAEIPTEPVSFTDRDGIKHSYNRRLGNEITDDHYRDCHEHRAFAHRRGTLVKALCGEAPLKNDYDGEAP